MKIKVFTPNVNGKIEFTPAELEKLLNDTYEEGQRNCNCGSKITLASPYIIPSTSGEATTSTVSNTSTPETHLVTTLNAADAKEMSKHINEIVKNVAAKIDSDAFSKLAKELNF
jgi:hypothetical protein